MFVAGELQSNLEPAYSRQRSRAACVDSTASTSASSSQLTGKGVTTFVERQLRFTYAAESRNESAAIPLLLQPLSTVFSTVCLELAAPTLIHNDSHQRLCFQPRLTTFLFNQAFMQH